MQQRKTLGDGSERAASDRGGDAAAPLADASFAARLQANRRGIWLAVALTLAALASVVIAHAPG